MWLKYGVIDIAKGYAVKFYNSKAWKRCRLSYISSVHGLCEHCLKDDKVIPGYIVDHIKEITLDNISDTNITLSHGNLQYLCLQCHNRKTFGYTTVIREGLMFDWKGNVIEVGEDV